MDGTLGYGTTLELYDRLVGDVHVAADGRRGDRAGRDAVAGDDRPVALMYGSVPAYRMLKQGVSDGPDVTELNQNLIDLGFDPYGAITDVEDFSEATAAAVRRWQYAEGLPETGEVELGRIVFAPGARRVTAVKVALGQDPPDGAGAKEPASEDQGSKEPVSEKPGPKEPDFQETILRKSCIQRTCLEKTGRQRAIQRTSGKRTCLQRTRNQRRRRRRRRWCWHGQVVLSTTSTQQIVQLKVKPEQQQLARLGERASPCCYPVTVGPGPRHRSRHGG